MKNLKELRLYRLTGGKVVTKAKDLPSVSVDAVVNALEVSTLSKHHIHYRVGAETGISSDRRISNRKPDI